MAERAREVLADSQVSKIWEEAGAEVRLVGSLRMGLIAKHRDIDLHVYSEGITEESSFAIAAKMARNPKVIEIKCLNGLATEERCIAWHLKYQMAEDEVWQIDIIHIEKGSRYDGCFEEMADRIIERTVADRALAETILKLKFETPDNEEIHGVEYYEAVIADGIRDLESLRDWVGEHRLKPARYWMPD